MFKRNPDAVALVLIACFLLVPAAWKLPASWGIPRQNVKVQLRRTVASLKQCLHLRSTPRHPAHLHPTHLHPTHIGPTQRPPI